ncbi:hypothetical protein M422DRAFT_44386 [Sphaerobolus stellatus SS14]|nr:hypothetical protein M422DRAFT_44386 [Sphaerobolus stellatus SS14]
MAGYVCGYHPLPCTSKYARFEDRLETPPEGSSDYAMANPKFNEEIEQCIEHLLQDSLVMCTIAHQTPDYTSQNLRNKDKLALTTWQLFLKPGPQKIEGIKKILRQDLTLQVKANTLLSKIIQVELKRDPHHTLDLSNFSALILQQLLNILIPHQTITSLNLSHNPNVTVDTLIDLLTHLPNLHCLFLFDTRITHEDFLTLVQTQPSLFYNTTALIHPAFVDQEDKDLAWTTDYAYIAAESSSYRYYSSQNTTTISLPFFTPAHVIQAILCLFKMADPDINLWPQNICHAKVLFQSAYTTEFNGNNPQLWNKLAISIYPQHFCIPSALTTHLAFCMGHFLKMLGAAAVKVLGEQLFKVYDLEGFVAACEKEDRSAVLEEVVQNAKDKIEKLNSLAHDWKPSIETLAPTDWKFPLARFEVMTPAEPELFSFNHA